MKKVLIILALIYIIIQILFIVNMRLNAYNVFVVNIPKKNPPGFKRVNIVKRIPPEKDWYFVTTYENSDKKQVIFNYEPQRNIRCGQDWWKMNLEVFRPKNSTLGCSFYQEHLNNQNKMTKLHWFLWNVDNNTYHIYDEESLLTNQEVMEMAESVGREIVIAKDLTKIK